MACMVAIEIAGVTSMWSIARCGRHDGNVGTQFAGDGFGSGAIQRVLAGTVLAWFLLIALHVRKKEFAQS